MSAQSFANNIDATSAFPDDDDPYAGLHSRVPNWTLVDHKRLSSINQLYNRSIEFHNNDHSFRATLNIDTTCARHQLLTDDLNDNSSETVLDAQICSKESKVAAIEISRARLSEYLSLVSIPKRGFLWLHVRDLIAVPKLALKFGLHKICSAAFHDLRAHSNILVTDSGNSMLATVCTMHMGLESVHMYKLYIYVSSGLIITFERELMPVPESSISLGLGLGSAYLSAVSPAVTPSNSMHDTSYTAGISGNNTNCSPQPLVASELLSNAVRCRLRLMIDDCELLGPVYLLYELVLEALSISDSVLEFYSRSIFFMKQKVHRNLSYEDKLATLRKLHIVQSGITMFEQQLAESTQVLSNLLDKMKAVNDLLHEKLLTSSLVPYILDMNSSYLFKLQCVQREVSEIHALNQAMDAVTQVRANQTQMSLSLIATVFLPMTFLAGVFGMNFTVNGGYTDPLLNRREGPVFFWTMCLVVVLLNILYFIRNGWLSLTLRLPSCLLFSDLKRDTTVAMLEEARRRDEAAQRRNISAAWPLNHVTDHSTGPSSEPRYRDRVNHLSISSDSKVHGRATGTGTGTGGNSSNTFKNLRSTSFVTGSDTKPLMDNIRNL